MSLDSRLPFVEIRLMKVKRARQDLSFVNEEYCLHSFDCRLKKEAESREEDICQLSRLIFVNEES